MLAIRQKV